MNNGFSGPFRMGVGEVSCRRLEGKVLIVGGPSIYNPLIDFISSSGMLCKYCTSHILERYSAQPLSRKSFLKEVASKSQFEG